jgi:tryptophan synthase beta chain
MLFAKAEGILPAPETNHAVKEAMDQALKAKENNEKKTIVFNFSGHGYFDLLAYKEYMTGDLENFELSEEKIQQSINDADMPQIDESAF